MQLGGSHKVKLKPESAITAHTHLKMRTLIKLFSAFCILFSFHFCFIFIYDFAFSFFNNNLKTILFLIEIQFDELQLATD